MKLKLKHESKVVVVVKDGYSKKSKTITVYDCTVEDMIKAVKELVENNAT